jgi:hypothetical protein
LHYAGEIDSPIPFGAVNFPFVIQNDQKLQTSQGYIIRILQHFATKLRNITNFVMLFQAVMKFLSRLVEFKILSITQGIAPLHWHKPFGIIGPYFGI